MAMTINSRGERVADVSCLHLSRPLARRRRNREDPRRDSPRRGGGGARGLGPAEQFVGRQWGNSELHVLRGERKDGKKEGRNCRRNDRYRSLMTN